MILIVIAVITALLISMFIGINLPPNNYWFGFTQNFSSDLIAGIVIGSILAFYISRRERAQQKQQRKDEIIRLLLQELNDNLSEISRNEEKLKGTSWQTWEALFPGLKNETWKAISEGGEVKWLDAESIGLLNHLSIIYHYLARVKMLEQEFSIALMRHKASGSGYEIIMLQPAIIDGYQKIKKYTIELLEITSNYT